jgi:N-dimethylarginine dimethylaminohydrolase
MTASIGAAALSEVGRLGLVLVKHATDAFVDEATTAAQWRDLGFTGRPDPARAAGEYQRFLEVLRSSGAELRFLPKHAATTLDSVYARDASVVCERGIVLCAMGKPQRSGEPAAQEETLRALGLPIIGRIEPPGRLEGGDVVWLDPRTLVVGRGYRTNAEGIRQLAGFAGPHVEVIEVPLPHWRGESDVMHLMSLVSPVDHDLAVVYSPLLPVPFRTRLLERGMRFVEVPHEEFDTMGCNVLALAPRQCLMLAGNPHTRAALERAGAEVVEYEGNEISVKGAGGPTCLTRPITRRP